MAKALKVHLLVIDPQVDFMDASGSSLPVAGATQDMKRLSALIGRVGHKFEDIHVTLDSHHTIDVGHPGMWRDRDGQMPNPFTLIFGKDIENGIWTPRDPSLRARMLTYANTLEKNGNYNLMVWPEHCKIGSPGHNVEANLLASLEAWERKEFATVNYVTKGTNPFTEHYGALMAEVPDPNDPSTMLNGDFLAMLQDADIVGVAGEALSHCVKSTVDQIARNIGDEHIKKFHILTDCSNPVPQVGGGPDFPAIAKKWLGEMQSQGMTLVSSADFLK
ncbi:MAG: hypothetical protein A3C93_00200 [Candidatus Lloydbacteria bacterium RIFCSPHIGHO2_02_FULL_54_17]|uniref:Isochorismatase-like domain-containing protein n=1 Tax=Candidatus Lloydbacteria bacterium RIFCSPHIGHO2_02_FULL_54_17 TaxID=1798664 RepID=A0A1G2DI16_9BACT|nr:MAG: hypothetical protein A2762_03950 [Candidatus Lloydbacteria bacterium RIFCSPHIGHO2_01_FULL_54_11]OGZ13324.1 MAG: hypothetical protein A3C93_00200 [Candidatus Lloydbacteria bacterium RIFCSPHIGHO2_02_FULL_54_17]OGZ17132.1 MAG: hypothetical protein A3H76_03000 [Candidatus Lloydbacteria bacterium RIFCSPLOWO2_02_FULL_54_12]